MARPGHGGWHGWRSVGSSAGRCRHGHSGHGDGADKPLAQLRRARVAPSHRRPKVIGSPNRKRDTRRGASQQPADWRRTVAVQGRRATTSVRHPTGNRIANVRSRRSAPPYNVDADRSTTSRCSGSSTSSSASGPTSTPNRSPGRSQPSVAASQVNVHEPACRSGRDVSVRGAAFGRAPRCAPSSCARLPSGCPPPTRCATTCSPDSASRHAAGSSVWRVARQRVNQRRPGPTATATRRRAIHAGNGNTTASTAHSKTPQASAQSEGPTGQGAGALVRDRGAMLFPLSPAIEPSRHGYRMPDPDADRQMGAAGAPVEVRTGSRDAASALNYVRRLLRR
jgi:hypothetical protein